mmetsp:Transcript_3525/g.8908  ORF Transcript_3525/g.8908 Transcript_3525/m.8908 type:complete len:227 (-) Transcript_3525:43-723(-)
MKMALVLAREKRRMAYADVLNVVHETGPNHHRLLLGSAVAATDEYQLDGVTHVLSVCDVEPSERFRTLWVNVPDEESTDILSHLDTCCKFIQTGLLHGSVLVHCRAGVSRSATVVVAYLMREEGLTAAQALDKVRTIRSVISPNAGFAAQLQVWEEMGCTLDSQSEAHKTWLIERSKGAGFATQLTAQERMAFRASTTDHKDPGFAAAAQQRRLAAIQGSALGKPS